jgi:ankyrin repeat protein
VVTALIARGAEVNARERWFRQTAIMWAAAENHPQVVEALAKAGADVNARPDVIDLGRRNGGTTTPSPGGLTALLYAARNGALAATRALIAAGADLDLADPNGSPPLVYAVINAHFDVAVLLLEKGASPNVYDSTGRGPLFVAVDMHRLEFIYNRPGPFLVDQHTSLDVARLLLEAGADVNHRLTNTIIAPKLFATGNRALTAGSTPFLKAATTSDVEMMRLLLAWGADPLLTNKAGSNALMLAAGLGWRVIVSRGTQEEAIAAVIICQAQGMDINSADTLGNTALHGAAQRTDDQDANELIRFLVAQGANLYAKNAAGRTPWDEANGERLTRVNAAVDNRATNRRSLALLVELMATHPDPAAGAPPAK